jgi:hypothetical protein
MRRRAGHDIPTTRGEKPSPTAVTLTTLNIGGGDIKS